MYFLSVTLRMSIIITPGLQVAVSGWLHHGWFNTTIFMMSSTLIMSFFSPLHLLSHVPQLATIEQNVYLDCMALYAILKHCIKNNQ